MRFVQADGANAAIVRELHLADHVTDTEPITLDEYRERQTVAGCSSPGPTTSGAPHRTHT